MEVAILTGTCVFYKNKTLLLKQPKDSLHNGLWGPPGGHMEEGETIIKAALRETKEETNLDVRLLGLIESGVKIIKSTVWVVAIYLAEPTNIQELKIQENEVSEYKWVGKKEILDDKFKLRDPLLKEILLKAFDKKVVDKEFFKLYK